MRFHSTVESALNLEVTKLAIIETVGSVALYVCVGLYIGSFRYLALAILVAPLMLFRTEVSAGWGLKAYARYNAIAERDNLILSMFGLVILGPLIGIGIRTVSTIYWAIRRPMMTLRQIPQNWLRQCFCTDFFHPPEVVPLEASKGKDDPHISHFSEVVKIVSNQENIVNKLLAFVLVSPVIVVGYLPPLIYRVTFKATSIVYLPFVWVVHATFWNPLSVKGRLERITKGELEKVRRGVSWVIVSALAAKIGLVLGLLDLSYFAEKLPSQRLAELLVVPGSWPLWQVTLVLDAFLTFFLFYFADAALARLTNKEAWSEGVVRDTVSTISFFRGILGIVTISHGIFLSFIEVDFFNSGGFSWL